MARNITSERRDYSGGVFTNAEKEFVTTDSLGRLTQKMSLADIAAEVLLLIGGNEVGSLTAFGEAAVSEATPVAGWTHAYSINADLVSVALVGTGAANSVDGKAELSTGAIGGSSATMETIKHLRYIPGQGGLIRFTSHFTDGLIGSQQIIGYGDQNDGFFFGYDGTEFGILHRQNGADNWIEQSTWNIDAKADLDPTLGNVYQIQFQWLGFGAITFSIEDRLTGMFIQVHRIEYANTSTSTSIRNPSLPIYASVGNPTSANDIKMSTPSAMAFVEGKYENDTLHPLDLPRGFEVPTNGILAGVEELIVAFRVTPTFQGIDNRLLYQPVRFSVAVDGSKTVVFRAYLGSTITGGTWVNYNPATSSLQSNTTATFSGGRVVTGWTTGKTASEDKDLVDFGIELGKEATILITAESSNISDVDIFATLLEKF